MSSELSDRDRSSPPPPPSPPPRNPSPPPVDKEEEVLKGDLIPGTAYSKHWLFATFLKLLKKVEGLQSEQSGGDSNEVSGNGDFDAGKDASDAGNGDVSPEKSAKMEARENGEVRGEEMPNGSSVSPSAHRSPLTEEKLDEMLPSGYEVLDPPASIRPGDKIDEETESELCQLWDMTIEPEVVKLMMEYNAIDLLVGAIYKSVGVEPRYTEIAVGILGNMACQREACAVMASNTKVMELIYWTLQISSDAPLLVETTRLVTTIFDSIREQETTPWIETLYGRCVLKTASVPLIEDRTVFSTVSSTDRGHVMKPDPSTTPSFSKSICFILKSSTRSDLLRNVLKFLDQIFECDRAADLVSALMHIWVVEYDLLDGLLECWKVIHDEKEDVVAINSWIHVMYLICQTCDMETRRSDRSSVSLKVGIIGILPKKSSAILTAVGGYLRWCLESDEVQTKWFVPIACSYNIAQALLIHSMTSLEIVELAVKLFHRIRVKWPVLDVKRRLQKGHPDRERNEVMTDKLLKYTFDSVFGFFSFVFERIIRDRQSPIIQDVVKTFERCPMSTLKSMSDLLDNWHKEERTLNQVSPLNPGIGAFESASNPLPAAAKCESTIAEVIGEMLRVAEERGTKKLAHVISSTATATTYTPSATQSTLVNTLGTR